MYAFTFGIFIVPEKILQSGHQFAPKMSIGCLSDLIVSFMKSLRSLAV